MLRYFVLLACLSATSALPACGYYILGEEYRIALFNPYVIGTDYQTFFYSSERFSHWPVYQSGRDERDNVELWARELGNGATGDDVAKILYGADLPAWLQAVEKDKGTAFAGNPAWRALQGRPEVLEYALYAKGYEAQSYWNTRWMKDDDTTADSPYRKDFRTRAQAGYAKAPKGSWLKERYAYQLLLLAYYRSDEEAMERYFTGHFKGKEGPLADWARFHFAGQWNDDGRLFVEMANAFRRVPQKSYAAYQRTQTEGEPFDPADYLSATRTDAERSNLYALAAIHHPGYALDLLETAYGYDPTSPVVELLVVRELNKLEDWLMTYELTYLEPTVPSRTISWERSDDYDSYRAYETARDKVLAGNYDRDRAHLRKFRRFLGDYQSARPDLDRLLRAQAALLSEDYDAALNYVDGLPEGKDAFGLQVATVRFLAAVQRKDITAAERDALVAKSLTFLESAIDEEDHLRYVPARLASQVYAAAGDTVTAYLLFNRTLRLPVGATWSSPEYARIDYLDRPISDGVMQRVIDLADGKTKGNDLHRLLLSDDELLPPVDMLRDLAGTLALRRNDLPAALAYFERIPAAFYEENYDWDLRWSPFSDLVGAKIRLTSKADVIRQMMAMEAMTEQGDDAAAAACLTLARAWYNMSYVGCSWNLLEYGHSSNLPEGAQPWPQGTKHRATPHSEEQFELRYRARRATDYLDCAEASVTDQELAAHIAFLRTQLTSDRTRLEMYALGYTDAAREKAAGMKQEIANNYAEFVRQYEETDYVVELRGQCEGLR